MFDAFAPSFPGANFAFLRMFTPAFDVPQAQQSGECRWWQAMARRTPSGGLTRNESAHAPTLCNRAERYARYIMLCAVFFAFRAAFAARPPPCRRRL